MMNDDDLLRYSRQIMLPDIDVAGQDKLIASTVLVMGLGGLGSPVVLYLAAAGIGHLILVDDDRVDLTNLQRQLLHGTDDVGRLKTESATTAVHRINPTTRVTEISERLDVASLSELLAQTDLVIDGTDNFNTRFMVNEACVSTGTPLISGAAIALEGQVMAIDPGSAGGPCYRCLYQDASDENFNCAENGVAAPVVGIIGAVMAMEALKMIVGFGESLVGYLLVFDARTMDWRKLRLKPNPNCQTCG